jgi:hypothetical protein
MEDGVMEELKFCPNCGHEGHDDECPVCQVKMESLSAEVDKLAEAEKDDETDDLTDPAEQVSLEAEAEEEQSSSIANDE